MSPRNRKLEQAKPKSDSPAKVAHRKFPPETAQKKKTFGGKDLPTGTITQNRVKAGITSPQ